MYLVNCIALHKSLLSSMYRQPTQCLEDHRFDILSGTQDFSLSFARDRMIFNLFYLKTSFTFGISFLFSFFFFSLLDCAWSLPFCTYDKYSKQFNSTSIFLYSGLWWRYSSLRYLGFDGYTAHYNLWDLLQIQLTILPGIWCINSSQNDLGFDGNRVKYTYWDFTQIQLALIPRIWCKYS